MAQQALLAKRVGTPETPRASPALSASAAGTKRKRGTEPKFYAVREGKKPGIYNTWTECLDQVRGHKGALFKAFPSLNEAQAFIENRKLPADLSSPQSSEPRFYAVQNGRRPGVYTDWTTAQAQIRGVRNPRYKKFGTRAEAEAFVTAGRKVLSTQSLVGLSEQEKARRAMIDRSAPGMVLNGNHEPKDKDGFSYDIGQGPLPPGAVDGFDPNIRLNADGTLVQKTQEAKSRTKMMSRDRDPPGMLRIYTDGSSLKNGQAGARAGVGVFFGPQDPKNVSEALKGTRQTNQRAELTAILRALEIAPRHRDVTIYTDSRYAIDCVTNWYKNWEKNKWMTAKGKAVENKDLVVDVRGKIEERDSLSKKTLFVWVKGHSGDAGNMAADRLAVEGAVSGRGITREVEAEEEAERAEVGQSQSESGGDSGGDDEDFEEVYRAMAEAMEGGGGGNGDIANAHSRGFGGIWK